MKPVTTYEVYQVKYGRWALRARFGGTELERALEIGREQEASSSLPVQVIEERFEPETGKTELTVVKRFGKAITEVKGAPEDADITARIFMVVLNSVGIGAILSAVAATVLAPLRDAAMHGAYNIFLLFLFSASTLTAGLLLFKLYVPMDLVLWRAKSKESRERAAQILLGTPVQNSTPVRPRKPAFTEPQRPLSPIERIAEPDEQTSFQFAPTEPAPPPPAAPQMGEQPALQTGQPPEQQAAETSASPPPAAPALSPEDAAARDKLFVFADSALALLALARPQATAFERFGFNLYLAGAASIALAALTPELKQTLLCRAMERAGTSIASAQPFVDRLEASIARPRFRTLYDAGAEAFTAPADENGMPRHDRLTMLMREWSDPTARGARAETVTFLLTDLVGSTALTAQIGNSGAQRVLRAHNTIVRTVAKDYRGKEVKHTGDGMLLTFTDPATAARAAMEIQSQADAYVRDNPEAPLSLRIGLHCGEANAEDGEYYGEAVLLIDGICAAADAGEIATSEEIVARATGPAFTFADAGPKALKGTEIERRVFKLAWKPKPRPIEGRLEYRQIGALPLTAEDVRAADS